MKQAFANMNTSQRHRSVLHSGGFVTRFLMELLPRFAACHLVVVAVFVGGSGIAQKPPVSAGVTCQLPAPRVGPSTWIDHSVPGGTMLSGDDSEAGSGGITFGSNVSATGDLRMSLGGFIYSSSDRVAHWPNIATGTNVIPPGGQNLA